MKVKELISNLKQLNEDATVFFDDEEWGSREVYEVIENKDGYYNIGTSDVILKN